MLKKTGFAAMILSAVMALMPATAMARDRDDYRRGYQSHERYERRDHDRYRGGWERGRGGVSFGFSFGAPARGYYAAPAPVNGYYDQYGYWHSYAPAGFYDQYGYWHQN